MRWAQRFIFANLAFALTCMTGTVILTITQTPLPWSVFIVPLVVWVAVFFGLKRVRKEA